MNGDSKELLALVRDAEDPTPADEERVLRALQAAVVAGATSSVLIHTGTERSSGSSKLLAKLTGPAVKASIATTVVAATLASVALLRAPTERKPVEVPRALAPADLPNEPRADPAAPVQNSAEPVEARQNPQAPARTVQTAPRVQRAARAASLPARASGRTGNSLRAEIALLSRVQAALKRGDGASALRALEKHNTTDRVLRAERQAARVLALCMLGRVVDAERAADAFFAEHPDSPQREAIERSCANSKRIGEH